MKYKNLSIFLLLFVGFYTSTYCQSVKWLNNRYLYINGCRQNGMAGAGFSFLDDASLLFMNPAGLGIENARFKKIAFLYGNGFEINRDWSYIDHEHYISTCFQPSKKCIKGLSILAYYRMFKLNDNLSETFYDPYTGEIIATDETYKIKDIHLVSVIGYGRDLSFIRLNNHAIGLSAVVNNRFYSNFGDQVRLNSLHLNAGYTGSFSDLFHIGLVIINVPVVKSFNKDYKIVTPFCISPSFGLSPVFVKRGDIDAFKMNVEFNYKVAFEKHEVFFDITSSSLGETKLINTHFFTNGYEFIINEKFLLRNGYSLIFDDEFNFKKFLIAGGVGACNRKHFEINLFFNLGLFASDYAGIDPAKRFGLSISFFNLGNN